jgi:hypothetical protein
MPPEQEKAYPEPSMLGLLPAYGIYVRHAADLSFQDINLSFAQDDTRPVVVLDDVAGAAFDNLKAERAGGAPTFVLRKVTGFLVRNSPGVPDRQLADAPQESF